MNNEIRNLLESADPQDRMDGVKQLAREGTNADLKFLAALYKSDPDPDVRDLALKAGRYIKKREAAAEWEADAGGNDPYMQDEDSYDYYEEEDADDAADAGDEASEKPKRKPVEKDVSPRDAERAQQLIEQAMTLSTRGRDDKAEIALRKAFALDPNLQFDQYSAGVAGDLLGMHQELAVEELLYGDVRPKRKSKNSVDEEENITFDNALVDLGIYWLVNAAIVILGFLGMVLAFGDAWSGVGTDDMFAVTMSSLLTASIPFVIIYALIVSIFQVLGLLLFQYVPIHIAATMMLGGEGSFLRLIRKVTPFVTLNAMNTAMMTGDLDAYNNAMGMYGWSSLIGLFVGIFAIYKFAERIGVTYDFGTGKGCVTILASIVLMGVFSCVCGIVFTQILGQAIFGGMEAQFYASMIALF